MHGPNRSQSSASQVDQDRLSLIAAADAAQTRTALDLAWLEERMAEGPNVDVKFTGCEDRTPDRTPTEPSTGVEVGGHSPNCSLVGGGNHA